MRKRPLSVMRSTCTGTPASAKRTNSGRTPISRRSAATPGRTGAAAAWQAYLDLPITARLLWDSSPNPDIERFARWRAMLPNEGHVVMAATLLEESGYTEMWKQDRSPEAPGRLDNLKELLRAMADYETLAGFLEHVSLVMENDENRAKAMCVLFNSIQFLVQFFLLKEESTGRYINVRFYDLAATRMYPSLHVVPQLRAVFDHYKSKNFPSLRQQFDRNFELRYKEFWDRQKSEGYQGKMWSVIDSGVEPSDLRLEFDLAVCNALDMKVSRDDLLTLYEVIVKEMIMTRHLTRD
jgi:hypothetical protein